MEQDDPRWLLAERIAASPSFTRSQRLAQLLLHLCRYALSEQADQISEQRIAAEVFGRTRGFDSATDTIVRSHMLRLRQKLDQYFKEEEANEPFLISIPRGRYIPSFLPNPGATSSEIIQPETVATEVEPEPPALVEPAPHRSTRQPMRWLAAALVVLLLIAGGIYLGVRPSQRQQYPAVRQMWTLLFPSHSSTLLVAADSGLVLLHGITGENTSLGEYVTHDLHRAATAARGMDPSRALELAGRRYTSFVDLELFNRLTHVPEAISGSYTIRYARDISINDLKSSNVVLSGSEDADPWVEAFEPQMNFVLDDHLRGNERGFANRKPLPGEDPRYPTGKAEYGVLAFLPNLAGTGNVLIIEGTSVSGTESASDLLFNDSKLEPFLEHIRRPDGSLPHFEILIEAENLGGSAAPSRIIASRVH